MKNQENKFKDLESRINTAENKLLHKEKKPSVNNYKYSFANVSYDLAGATVGSIVLGVILDNYFGTTPWLLIVMSILGVASGILLLWKKQQASLTEEKENKDK